MITTRPIGRAIAVLILSTAAAGSAAAGIGGVGGVTPLQEYEQSQVCPAGKPALTAERIRSILKRRGYYAIRGLRYLKPLPREWIASIAAGGRYVATASRGFGIVRWQLTVDPCTARVAVERQTTTRTH